MSGNWPVGSPWSSWGSRISCCRFWWPSCGCPVEYIVLFHCQCWWLLLLLVSFSGWRMICTTSQHYIQAFCMLLSASQYQSFYLSSVVKVYEYITKSTLMYNNFYLFFPTKMILIQLSAILFYYLHFLLLLAIQLLCFCELPLALATLLYNNHTDGTPPLQWRR